MCYQGPGRCRITAHLLGLEARHAVHRVRRRTAEQRHPWAVAQRGICLQQCMHMAAVRSSTEAFL